MAGNQTAPTRAKRDDRPWWVKQRRFAVPSTLQVHIHNLPEEIQVFFCYIVSKIVIESKKHPTLYHPIASKYFNDFVGSEYRDFLNLLVGWKIIEINEAYQNDAGKGFTKSYRLHPTALAVSTVKLDFKKKVVQPLRDKSDLKDDVAEFVHDNLKRLDVKTDLLPQDSAIDEVDAVDWAERIHFQQFNVHYSPKAKRLYHAAISMPKIARRNLILKADASVPLFEYDVKSCMPVILLGLIQDPAERATLTALLDGDIYTTIANEQGVTKIRADIKDDFLMFVNGAVRNYVYTFFHQHLPTLAERLVANKGAKASTAWFGQRVESEIMGQEVPRQLMQTVTAPSSVNYLPLSLTSRGNSPDGILYIPMHDGWLGVERDEQRIADTVRNEFHRRLGYWVGITKTKLETGDKIVLAEGPPLTVAR
jgi:hypothetical protein